MLTIISARKANSISKKASDFEGSYFAYISTAIENAAKGGLFSFVLPSTFSGVSIDTAMQNNLCDQLERYGYFIDKTPGYITVKW